MFFRIFRVLLSASPIQKDPFLRDSASKTVSSSPLYSLFFSPFSSLFLLYSPFSSLFLLFLPLFFSIPSFSLPFPLYSLFTPPFPLCSLFFPSLPTVAGPSFPLFSACCHSPEGRVSATTLQRMDSKRGQSYFSSNSSCFFFPLSNQNH